MIGVGSLFEENMELKNLGKHEEEVKLFHSVLGKLNQESIVGIEIGCLWGESAETILKSNENIFLLSIDPFIPDSMASHLIGDYSICCYRLKDFIKDNRFMLYRGYSWDFVSLVKDNSLDFVFIDGDHTYESVLRDYNEWSNKIKINGLLFLHDSRKFRPINPSLYHDGPSKVAEECIINNKKWKIIEEAGSLLCVKKNY